MRRVLAMATFLFMTPACGGSAPPPVSAPSSAEASGAKTPDPPPSGPPRDVDCGDFTTCALAGDGEARCWGRDKAGELGDGGGADKPKDAPVRELGKVVHVALAAQFGCALTVEKKVKCWGTGRIANDGKAYTSARPTEVAGLAGVDELVASGAIACARTGEGVTCWGADASTIGSPPKGAFTQLAAGFSHACALDKTGAVTCWGGGDWGGKGAFVKPPITGATFLATGDRHACVIGKDKKVKCWGSNDAGQLGTKPDIETHKKPVDVPGVTGAVRLVTGEASTCAILGDGAVRCWGANNEGELALGKRSADERVSKVSALSDVASMCLGSTHGCAVTKQSKLWCWGGNAHGQVGDGSKERRTDPVEVAW
jgi:alpha-tubulin suppressor-like RCC1 family protein